MNVIIYTDQKTPRLEYILKFLLSKIASLAISVTTDLEEFNVHKGLRINYSNSTLSGAFNIFPAGLLDEKEIKHHEIHIEPFHEGIMFFVAPEDYDFPFDIFSAAFYLVSRYEEYLPFKPDNYGRFEADQSMAFHHGFLDIPIVDHWVMALMKSIRTKFPGFNFTERHYNFLPTIDVDSPWAYLHKGIVRTTGGIIKSLVRFDFKDFTHRVAVLTGHKHDPFDTFKYLQKIEQDHRLHAVYFFLTGNYGKEDTNYALHNHHFKQLINQTKARCDIGMHPSYRSFHHEKMLQQEFEWFSVLTGNAVKKSRQHFLMVQFPGTFERLIKLGIREDFSLGYASQAGFRAGTCTPFNFYDLSEEKETGLMLYPFAVMDVTMQQYLNYNPQKAIEVIHDLISEVKQVNGTFISLWHNESLSDEGKWKGWRHVFEEMVKEAV